MWPRAPSSLPKAPDVGENRCKLRNILFDELTNATATNLFYIWKVREHADASYESAIFRCRRFAQPSSVFDAFPLRSCSSSRDVADAHLRSSPSASLARARRRALANDWCWRG